MPLRQDPTRCPFHYQRESYGNPTDRLAVGQSYAEAAKWRLRAAEQGVAISQCELGMLYERGRGVALDFVQAHKWYSLAAIYERKPEKREECAGLRDALVGRMTPEGLADAQRLAAEWRPKLEIPADASPGVRPGSWPRVAPQRVPPEALPSNDIVFMIQQSLRKLGYDPGPLDGVIGPKTRAAVKQFEDDRGLPETGEIAPTLFVQVLDEAVDKAGWPL